MAYDFELEERKKGIKKILIGIVITIIEVAAVIGLAYAITHKGLATMKISGESMSPTLKEDDSILINRMIYKLFSVKRNDVVVVKQDGAEHSYFEVCRVIGLPGETVKIEEGDVYIDGNKLEEKLPFEKMENGGLALDEITLDKDEYFMLCDNRNQAEDSRNANVGNIHKKDIVWKAWFRLNSVAVISSIDNFEIEKTEEK